jgi:hypothetical protein
MKLQETRGHKLLLLFIAFIFALALHSEKAQAQIIGTLQADIPFQFHAGSTELPAGNYSIQVLDDSDLTIMKISSADGSKSALFSVVAAQAKSEPAKNELTFNKYGDQYFLASLFEEGNPDGSHVVESRDEKNLARNASETEEHVAANRQGQPGN